MSQVVIIVEIGGATRVKVEGVSGPTCAKASEPYRAQLAGAETKEKSTEEMYQIPNNQDQTLKESQ
jgi:hypothetical protein